MEQRTKDSRWWFALALLGGGLALAYALGVYWPGLESEAYSRDISALSSEQKTVSIESSAMPPVDKKLPAVAELVEGLRERLERKPDDAQGWVLLAKSYQHLQRWDEAEAAFAKAEVLGYSSAVAGQGLGQQVSSAPVFQAIDQMVAEEDKPKVGPAIHLQLSVSSDIAAQLAPEQRVFVFARPLTGGPPLAVVRKTVAELPAEIILNEQVAMVPEHGLSTGAYIVVGARISATGQPEKSPGDIEVLSEAIVVSKDTRLGLMLGAPVVGE